MKISGNTILVTGGGSGIGRELARRFNDLGNTVIVAGRRLDALHETIGDRSDMHALTLNLRGSGEIWEFARKMATHFSRLNVLVNNAGIMQREDLTESSHLDTAEATIETNLLGTIRLTSALTEHFRHQEDATVINVTSGLAFVPLSSFPSYSATKAALHSYTMSLREQLKGQIEVFEIAPPGVRTDLTPGQASRDAFMPLGEFIDETMALLMATPTPAEILVDRVKPLRNAEAEGRFSAMFQMLASH